MARRRRLPRLPHPAGVRADALGSAAMAGPSELATRLRTELGRPPGHRRPAASCAPTSATGWRTTGRPGGRRAAEHHRGCRRVVRACIDAGRAVRRPRLRHRPVRRCPAACRGRAGRHLPDARRSSRSTAARPAGGGRAGRDQPARDPAAAPGGYYYAPDPSSQQVCSIGGNVAENSGGAHCLKYGFTTNHVLGVELVDARRRVVSSAARRPTPPATTCWARSSAARAPSASRPR